MAKKHSIYGPGADDGITNTPPVSGVYGENSQSRIDKQVDSIVDRVVQHQEGLATIGALLDEPQITDARDSTRTVADSRTTESVKQEQKRDVAPRKK